ncbi:F0F1 ATP synthase subunit epsilon [Eggerthellaceae bacterium zg-1084]|uniref:ATP synthase epsilon chain n=1 Tax=Berryella wangjianweii TaxID=2734634 RepID=A0A6M8J1D2_9ACTN|nr:F0F1 ATP synthase subunit epsilon [Berryella wangjianweii]NPD30787.1 F0F1 ATP synthase subunit epsilon [Berryella wangjianweii]NPD31994.1 F0F1 ATP synthase subunit epsilon [Eggerthellaceae bacterium zg-997]QKF07417.1 F0F1 ATP synthase subunit epsilon [Berryella wangjianweii]
MPKYRCVVAVPDRELYAGEVDYASIPGASGDYGVMSGHAGFVSMNRTGILSLWLDPQGAEKRQFLISGGVAQVIDDCLSVLPRFGIALDAIDAKAVETEAGKLREKIEQHAEAGSEADEAALQLDRDALAWCEEQLKAVRA